MSLLYAQAFQALYYSADQIHHGPLPRHVRFVLDEFAAMPLPGFTRELATMRSRSISASVIIQNMAQIKELYKDSWGTIPGNCDTILYLGGNESSTHKYVSEMLGKATIDTKTHGQTKGKSGSYSTNFQMSGRELLTPDEVRKLDNRYAPLFIRGASPVMDEKYDLIAPSSDLTQFPRRRSALYPSWNQPAHLHRPSAVSCGRHRKFESIEGGISLKKQFESKAKRLYSIFASVFFMLAVFVVPAFAADGDPLAVVNNLSDFIFSLIRAVGLILLGFGILQVGLSLKSHDPSQRANGILTVAGGIVITFTKEILTLITG